jgi:hypothetical protein
VGLTFLSNEFPGHARQEKSKSRPSKNERVGHPEELKQFLGVDVLEWYHSTVQKYQQEKRERVGHPPWHRAIQTRSRLR